MTNEEKAIEYYRVRYLKGIDREKMHERRIGFLAGAEHGYKEAIALAKEWIRDRNRHACQEWLDKECGDFEADMNKLWEEKK